MVIQIIGLNKPYVFERVSRKYSIYKKLYSIDLVGIEIRKLQKREAERIKNSFLAMNVMSYIHLNDENSADFLALGTTDYFEEILENNPENSDEIFRKVKHKLSGFTERKKEHGKGGKGVPRIMGILNVTPDSFSDGGKYFDRQLAVNRALEMLDQGADVIDIGGESTRPGSQEVKLKDELNRVMPVIEDILKIRPEAVISIDTYKSAVAREALEAGAKIVNDISGGMFDSSMFRVVAEYDAEIVLMHIKGTPKTMQKNPVYSDVVNEIYDYFCERISAATVEGVKKIIIDPGIGFGKRVFDNYELISRLDEFLTLGYPILIGLSRKSFLGKALNIEVNEREIPTIIAETIAAFNGAEWIRTHNVKNALFLKKLIKYFKNPVELAHV